MIYTGNLFFQKYSYVIINKDHHHTSTNRPREARNQPGQRTARTRSQTVRHTCTTWQTAPPAPPGVGKGDTNNSRTSSTAPLLYVGHGRSPHRCCTPSRFALLTGSYPTTAPNLAAKKALRWIHFNTYMNATSGRTSLPAQLSQRGYLSFFLGKWHLSEDEPAGARPSL